MNFIITWLFDKLGYMPKIDMQVGKINLDVKSPEFQMWPFPVVSEDFDPRPKKKPTIKKATTRPAKKKPAVTAKTARTKKAK